VHGLRRLTSKADFCLLGRWKFCTFIYSIGHFNTAQEIHFIDLELRFVVRRTTPRITIGKMGTGKKEASRIQRQGKSESGVGNVKIKGENFYRSGKRVKALNVFKSGRATRNAAGDITQAAVFQSRDQPNARIEPNRKWFGNTRGASISALVRLSTLTSSSSHCPGQPYPISRRYSQGPIRPALIPFEAQ